VLTWI